MSTSEGAILTLEPLIEAVLDGVKPTGWSMSGLQKTTSVQFEGRWEGESTRSAYLFFHLPSGPGAASLDVFLDETGRGLDGNLALVVDARTLAEIGEVEASLGALAEIARSALPQMYRTPVTLRFHLEGLDTEPGTAGAEIRFKVRIPRDRLSMGPSAVSEMVEASASALRGLLDDPRLAPFLDTE